MSDAGREQFLEAENEGLRAENAALASEVEVVRAENAALTRRVDELTRRIARDRRTRRRHRRPTHRRTRRRRPRPGQIAGPRRRRNARTTWNVGGASSPELRERTSRSGPTPTRSSTTSRPIAGPVATTSPMLRSKGWSAARAARLHRYANGLPRALNNAA